MSLVTVDSGSGGFHTDWFSKPLESQIAALRQKELMYWSLGINRNGNVKNRR